MYDFNDLIVFKDYFSFLLENIFDCAIGDSKDPTSVEVIKNIKRILARVSGLR